MRCALSAAAALAPLAARSGFQQVQCIWRQLTKAPAQTWRPAVPVPRSVFCFGIVEHVFVFVAYFVVPTAQIGAGLVAGAETQLRSVKVPLFNQ